MTDRTLEVSGLSKRFGGLVAVDDVSFGMGQGEALGVVGPNGAGKTTLFNCMTGFERPSAGRVIFRGRDLVGMRPHEIARAGLARTFQIVKPFADFSVIDNVMVPLIARRVRQAESEALNVLKAVGLRNEADRPAAQLPEGHLKRLEIARALATSPRVLLLDEPFAGLTEAEIASLAEPIRSLRERGASLIIVEHRLRSLLELVTRIIVLDRGALIADGLPREVMRERRVVEAYLGDTGDHLSGGV